MGATPAIVDFSASGFVKYIKGIQYDIRMLQEKLNHCLDNTGLSVPAPGTTQLDGNLNIMDLGRETFYGGSLLMQDTHGRQWLYAGGFNTNGFGVQLKRIDGSTALLFSDNDPVNETVQLIGLYDRGGYALTAEDKSGAGASWPLAPIPFAPLTWGSWANNTTSTFTSVTSATTYKSSPRFYLTANAICDGTAAGEVRLMVNGTQVGSTVTVPNLTMTSTNFGTPAVVAGNIGDALTMTVDARVTSGSGKCYSTVTAAMYWPSA